MKTFSFLLYSFVEWNINDPATAISLGMDGTLNMAIDASYVLDICSNFLVVDHSEYVQFAHLSVAEYLKGGHAAIVFSDIDAHAKIAEVCIAYVMSPSAQETVTKREYHRRYSHGPHFRERNELRQTDTKGMVAPVEANVNLLNISGPVPSSQEDFANDVLTVYSYNDRMLADDSLDLHSYAFLLGLEHCELASMVKRQEGMLCRLFTSFMSMVETNAPSLTWIPRKRRRVPGNWTDQIGFHDCHIKRRHVRADPQDAFFAACVYGFTEILQKLMDSVVNVNVNRRNETGEPGIWIASRYGHFSVVELLLNEGAEVDIRDNHLGFTPLYEAAIEGHANIVALLLSHGADASARFKEYYGYYFDLLDDNDDDDMEDNDDDEDHENNNPDGLDETLLHAISRKCREPMQESKMLSVVSLLLKHGASIEAVDSRLRIPLHIACSDDELIPVSTLLHHGARPGALDNGGYTPLMYATISGQTVSGPTAAVKLLLNKASVADIVCRNTEAHSILSLSLSKHSPDFTKMLLDTVDLRAAQELGSKEGDEFVELSQLLKSSGHAIFRIGWQVISIIASGLQSQRSVINCLRAIVGKADLGKMDWNDADLSDELRKEGFDLGLGPANAARWKDEDDTKIDDTEMTVLDVDGTVATPLGAGKRVRFVGVDEYIL